MKLENRRTEEEFCIISISTDINRNVYELAKLKKEYLIELLGKSEITMETLLIIYN